MLVALIALVATGAVTTLGNTINTVFWQAIAAFQHLTHSGPSPSS